MKNRQRSQGFSLLEMLLVMVILALTATLVVPAVGEGARRLRVRNMVSQFALDLSAARWTAVSGRTAVDLVVTVDPANRYEYTDHHGRLRSVRCPTASASSARPARSSSSPTCRSSGARRR